MDYCEFKIWLLHLKKFPIGDYLQQYLSAETLKTVLILGGAKGVKTTDVAPWLGNLVSSQVKDTFVQSVDSATLVSAWDKWQGNVKNA